MVLLNKRSQIETMGLVIIIIILVFALIFVLQFIIKPEPNKLNERHLQLNSDNLRSAILKTNVCKDVSIKDEIINCNNFNRANCLENCDKLNLIIKEIIQVSVKNNYEFDAGNINIKDEGCSGKDLQSSSTQPLALTDIKVNIKLCHRR